LLKTFSSASKKKKRMKKFYFLFSILLLVAFAAHAIPPAEALAHMKTADGFTVKQVASEPEIRQPLCINFDDRGRLWVIQYLQYPTPAGLKPVKVDQYLRTTYDKLPEPPPRGPKGADRITICENFDSNSRAQKFKNFLGDLNLCSGFALGYGGVFVAQPPYLLFYADKNHDDIPDGDPEVLLTGFGMEDAHAFANSLTWGPDGWLYGAQGSTVTAKIRGIEFQQGIWRYHPRTHEFELFAEGGGNTWGVDFDQDGELLAGTNWNDKMLHYVQGAYYIKGFAKHGALHNPHAYGYFDHVPYSGYRGGHLATGGLVYQGGAFPKSFNGVYIFANSLDNAVYWADLRTNASTFTAKFGGAFLKTDDKWFRPVNCALGPDGAVYIADWYDKRITHVDPLDTWDRSNGRIYKIESADASPTNSKNFDLQKLSSDQLVDLLSNQNDWFVRNARRILAERRDEKILPRLRKQIFQSADKHLQIESLWAFYVSGGFNDALVEKFLQHTNEDIRQWTVRFLGDTKTIFLSDPKTISPTHRAQRAQLVRLARNEASEVVRRQLASSCKRWPAGDALPIIHELLLRGRDAADPFIPLLLWWAIEDKAISNRAEVLKVFTDKKIWESPMVQKEILERLARRYAAEGNDADFAACKKLIELTPMNRTSSRTEDARPVIQLAEARLSPALTALLDGIEQGIAGRSFEKSPAPLEKIFTGVWAENKNDLAVVRLGLRLKNVEAQSSALNLIRDEKIPEAERAALIEIFGQANLRDGSATLLEILQQFKSEKLRGAALSALQGFSQPEIPREILRLYPQFNSALRAQVRSACVTRASWAAALLDVIEIKKIPANEISVEQARQMAALKNSDLSKRVEKIWGKIQAESPAEKQNVINRLRLVLKPAGAAGRDAKGNPAEGKKIFQQTCGVCHKLFGEGNSIGPDLTGVDRKNTEFLLSNVVNPSGYIRPEFVSYEVEMKDDQSLSGLMAESDANSVTLLDRNNLRHVLARDKIKELRESQISLMPEGLLEALQPQQVMDLFSYLQSDWPKP